ncbi:MAG: hypothetical protein WCP69_14730, partial [Bacteroidota bacterium]
WRHKRKRLRKFCKSYVIPALSGPEKSGIYDSIFFRGFSKNNQIALSTKQQLNSNLLFYRNTAASPKAPHDFRRRRDVLVTSMLR